MVSICIRKFIGLRGFEEMDNQGNNQDSVSGALVPDRQTNGVPTPSSGEKWASKINNLAKMILPAFISAAIIAIVADYRSIGPMQTRIENIDKNIEKIGERLDKIDGSDDNSLVSKFHKLEGKLEAGNDFQSDKDSLKDDDNKIIYLKCNPTDSTLQTMIAPVSSGELQDGQVAEWSEDAVIAEDAETRIKYRAKDLEKKSILVPYTEDGHEVYFLGQFNENGHWDGECTINVYIEDKLYLINDAVYEDGKLVKYNQVLDNGETWIIADRKPKANYNTGNSVTYRKKKEKEKNFDLKSVESEDVLSVEDFRAGLKERDKEGFYYGRTSGGNYNDKTGKAYMVKYDKKGFVRTIYFGGFKGGDLDDDTGNAWEIARNEGDSQYVFFKGKFNNGNADITNNNKKKPISLRKIHKKIDGIDFECSIDLYGE